MNFHLYVDDMQLFFNFDSCVPSTGDAAIIQLKSCITEIRAWMLINKLKLNDDKTEFLHFLPNQSMSASEELRGDLGLQTFSEQSYYMNLQGCELSPVSSDYDTKISYI